MPPDDDNYDDGTTDGTGQPENANIRQLRDKAGRTDTAEAEAKTLREQNQALQRELLTRRLGIDASKGTGKLFADSYRGELTEDAMKAAAAEYDLLPKPQATQDAAGDEPTADQVAAAQRVQQAGQGGQHTSDSSDLEREINELPPYGHPDWAKGRQQFHRIITDHGGRVVRERLTKDQARLVNPMTGQPMKSSEVPVSQITPPS